MQLWLIAIAAASRCVLHEQDARGLHEQDTQGDSFQLPSCPGTPATRADRPGSLGVAPGHVGRMHLLSAGTSKATLSSARRACIVAYPDFLGGFHPQRIYLRPLGTFMPLAGHAFSCKRPRARTAHFKTMRAPPARVPEQSRHAKAHRKTWPTSCASASATAREMSRRRPMQALPAMPYPSVVFLRPRPSRGIKRKLNRRATSHS